MEQTNNFTFYKQQLVEYHKRIMKGDELTRGFNLIVDQQELRGILNNLNKTFPKEPTVADHYTMYFAYADVHPEHLTEDDKKQWWKHSKKFIDTCPKEHNLSHHIYSVIRNLPKMGASSGQKFNCALSALNLLPKNFPYYQDCRKQVEKIARTDYEVLFEKAKKETNYQKQIKAFDRALARITDIPAGDRYRTFYECMRTMWPIYEKTDWGKIEFPHKKALVSNRIFKSLPQELKTIIRNRKSAKDWLSK